VQWYNGDQKEEEFSSGNRDFAPVNQPETKRAPVELPIDLVLLLRNSIS